MRSALSRENLPSLHLSSLISQCFVLSNHAGMTKSEYTVTYFVGFRTAKFPFNKVVDIVIGFGVVGLIGLLITRRSVWGTYTHRAAPHRAAAADVR